MDPLRGLLPGVIAGEAEAIERFIRATAPAVMRVVRQILGIYHPEVPDVVQEATFAALDALGRYRGDCTVLHFVCRVSVLTAMNTRRNWKLRERYAADETAYDTVESDEPSPYGLVVAARRRDALRQLLEELPIAQAEALIMHTVLGWTVEDAAEAAGVPENTVRSRMIAARTALKKKLLDNPELNDLLRGAS